MQMYIITSSENMELVKFTAGVVGTLLYFCIVLALWRILWCTVSQLNSPVMKVTGLVSYWVVWVLMLAVWLALDPLFTDASILLGVLAGMIIAAIICIMIAIEILIRAYMHERQDEHHEEALM